MRLFVVEISPWMKHLGRRWFAIFLEFERFGPLPICATKSNYGYDRAKITLHDDTCVFLSVFRPPEITRLPHRPDCYEIWYPAERAAPSFDVTGSKASLIKMFPGWPQSGQFDCLLTLRLFFSLFPFFSDVLHAKLLRHPIELKLVAKQFTAPMDISFSFDTTVNSVHSSAL